MKHLLIFIFIFNMHNIYAEAIININNSDDVWINHRYVGKGPMIIKGLKSGNHLLKVGLHRYKIVSPSNCTIERTIGRAFSPHRYKAQPISSSAAGMNRQQRRKKEKRNRNKGLAGIAILNNIIPGKHRKKLNKGLAVGAVLNNIFK